MINKENLKKNYNSACDAYLNAFCKKHSYHYGSDIFWVAGDVGGTACIGDYFVGMDTIRTDIDTDASEEKFLQWYDYCCEVGSLGCDSPTFKKYLNGCPLRTPEEIEIMKDLQQKVKNAERLLEEMINKDREGKV